jgi:adenine-specific DNA-methyltransferase
MVAAIDDLIAQIEDRVLRERLTIETDRISKEKKFGLVFEEHLPELTPLYSAEIHVGSRVARRGGDLSELWRVLSISAGQAVCINYKSGEKSKLPIDEIMAVANFGESIFPTLVPVNRVRNGSDDAPWHTLIEADNYHALQLLEYLYPGQVDCIYIDPPYNTGARDWKYNNDYVDANDSWRHSKWLAMMRRRLLLAFTLLKPDGIMVITIDDNEVHHLRMLLEEACFGQIVELGVACIRNNPGGRATASGFSVNHEYAIFIGKTNMARPGRMERTPEQISRYDQVDNKGPFEWANFRKHGAGSNRSDRKRQYYPIYVSSSKGIRVPQMTWDETNSAWTDIEIPRPNEIVVWPVRTMYGTMVEKVWSWGVERTKDNLSEFTAKTARDGTTQIYKKERVPAEGRLPITWWDSKFYSSNEYGDKLLSQIFSDVNITFQYPKSPYAVIDALKAASIMDKKQALVLDFFAGSGTTLNAVNLLNAIDGGQRHCIMVTNNEVSEDEAKGLRAKGLLPGDDEWEKHGICQAITWPRSKYTILGQRDDGTEIEGEYFTGKFVEKKKPRNFYHIDFASSEVFNTAARKKRFVRIIEGIPQSLVRPDSAFILSDNEKHFASVLFDDTQVDAWLDALTDHEHITDFYIVTERPANFNSVKDQITELLGPMTVTEEEKRPIKDGFETNLEYFRLEFLDKDRVALGRQFREILPLLWLRSGAVGPRPELPDDESIPAILDTQR